MLLVRRLAFVQQVAHAVNDFSGALRFFAQTLHRVANFAGLQRQGIQAGPGYGRIIADRRQRLIQFMGDAGGKLGQTGQTRRVLE